MTQAKNSKIIYGVLWLTLLIAGVIYVSGNLNLVTDLSQFIPAKRSTDISSEIYKTFSSIGIYYNQQHSIRKVSGQL